MFCEHDIEEIQRNQSSYAADLAQHLLEDIPEIYEDDLTEGEMLDALACQGLALIPIKMIGKNVASHAYLGQQ